MTVFRNAITLTLASIASRALLFTREGFLAASLGPSTYGVWVQITTLLSYALHLPLGFQNILSRDVPFNLGRGDKEKLSAMTGATKFVTLSTAMLATILILSVSFFNINLFYYKSLYLSLAVLIFIQQFNGYLSVLLRAEEKFVDYSIGLVLISIIGLVGAAIAIDNLGIFAPIVFQGVALFFVTVYWMRRTEKYCSSSLSVNYHNALRLLPQALPLFIGGAISFFIVSLDRLLIVSFYPKDDAGLYGFAFVLTQSVYLVVSPVVNIFNTRMMRDYGSSNSKNILIPYFFLFSYILPILVIFFLGVVCLSAEVIAGIWFPQYQLSIGILKALSVGLAPLLIASGVQMLFVARNKEKLVMWTNVSFAVIQIILYCTSVYFGFGILEMAWVVVVFYIFYSIYYLFVFASLESGGLARIAYFFKRFYFPVALYSLFIFWIVDLKINGLDQLLILTFKILMLVAVAINFIYRCSAVLRFLISDSVKTVIVDGKTVVRNAH